MARKIWLPLYYWQYDEESGDLLDTIGVFYWDTSATLSIASSYQALFWTSSSIAAYDLGVGGTAALNTLANVPQAAGTVMFYYRLGSTTTTALFRATEDDFDTGIQIACISGTQVTVQKGTSAVNDTISIAGLTGGRWYHVAYSWDDVANEHRLIVYDTVTATANDTGVQSQTQTQPACEYFALNTSSAFHVFSSLKVYDAVLTPAEIATERDDFPTPTPEAKPYSVPTLLARYKLFTSTEESLSGTFATAIGDIQFQQPDKPTSNNAVASTRYNETSTSGNIQHSPLPTLMEDFNLLRGSIMFWAKVDFDWGVTSTYQLARVFFPTSPISELLITFSPNSVTPSISFEIETGITAATYTYGKAITAFTTTTNWAHYCLTWNIETHTVVLYQYEGGVLNTFTYLDWDGTVPKSADATQLGIGTIAGSQNFKGWLCDMKFFYDALTPAQIAAERYNFSEVQALQDYLLTTEIEGDTLVDRDLLPATQNSLNTQRITIYREDGRTPLDLSDGDGSTTVTGWIKPYRKEERAITGTLSVVSGSETEGLVDWTYSAGDTEDSGEHYVQFKVVNTDSTSGYTYITPPRYWNINRDFSD